MVSARILGRASGACFSILMVVACLAVTARAASTDLDPSYGSGGLVVEPTVFNQVGGFDFLGDGRAATLGRRPAADELSFSNIWSVARLTPTGTFDPSFGSLGFSSQTVSSYGGVPFGVAITPGGVAATGRAQFPGQYSGAYRWVSYRAGADASAPRDDWFYSISAHCEAHTVLSLPDGRLLTAGVCDGHPFVVRHATSGTAPDTTFHASGASPPGPTTAAYHDVAVLPDGRYIAVGVKPDSGSGDIFFAFHQPDGVVGTPLGNGSTPAPKVAVDVAGKSDGAFGVAVLPNNKALLAGYSTPSTGGSKRLSITRVNPDGTVDTGFGTNGTTSIPPRTGDGDSQFNDVAVQADGRILAAGHVTVGAVTTAVVARFEANGAINPSFGVGGQLRDVPGTTSSSYKEVQQLSNGKIMLGAQGTLTSDGTIRAIVLRLAGDPSSGTSGKRASAKLKSPSKSKLKAKKFKSISGTATDAVEVEVAVLKTDKSLLKKKKRCRQLSSARAKFTKVKAVKKKCAPVKWLAATGTTNWKFKLKKTLPVGKYTIYVRATGGDSVSPLVKKSLKLTK